MKRWIRQAWGLQPSWLRRLELRIIAYTFAPKLDPKRLILKGDVVVGGFIGTATGLGESARHVLRQFQAAGIEAYPSNVSKFAVMEDFEAGPLWPEQASAGGIAIFQVNPDMFNLVMAAIGWQRLIQRRVIGLWAWELEVVPHQWIHTMRSVDEIWVISHFIANAFKKVMPKKPIYVVPPPLDIANFPTEPRVDLLPQFKGRPIVFFMYDVRSTHARKNPEAVIEAFRRATVNDPKSVLVLKINNSSTWPESLRRVEEATKGMENVHIIREKYSTEQMKDLLARVDIIMSLHRSEGFGFLMAEGMAAGKPVIATGWSSNLDFMTNDCSVLIDCKLIPAHDIQHIYDKFGAVWADPDIDQAAAALRRLLDDPAERKRMGTAARAHITRYMSPDSWFGSLPESFWQALLDPKAREKAKKSVVAAA